MRLLPPASASSAACAAIQEKIPVVIGQANVALCLAANAARSSFMVASFPFGTCFINASTSSGAGMTIVPSPQRQLILPVTRLTRGKPLSSASFSRHDFRAVMDWFFLKMSYDFDLNIRAFGQCCDLHRRTRGKVRCEVLCLHLVHCSEFCQVGHEDGGPYDTRERQFLIVENSFD